MSALPSVSAWAPGGQEAASGRSVTGAGRPRGHTTRIGGITLGFGLLLMVIALRAFNQWLLLVGAALLAPVLVSHLLRPDLRHVSLCFRGPDRVVRGETVEHVLHAHNHGRRSLPELRLTHRHRGFETQVVVVPPMPPGGSAGVLVRRPATERCVSDIHQLELRSTAPFGLVVHTRRLQVGAMIRVHPARARPAALPPGVRLTLPAGRSARIGDEPHELREWRRGDSLRQVHWRATARHDRLTVVIPEDTEGARFAMVVLGPPVGTDWEDMVATAAWTAAEAVGAGAEVRLSALGLPDQLPDDPQAVLDWFASLRPVAAETVGRPPGVAGTAELVDEALRWAGPGTPVIAAVTRPAMWPDLPGKGALLLEPNGRVQS